MWRAGTTLHRGARASHCRGFSCCGAQAPDAQAQQLWLTGPVAPRHVGPGLEPAYTLYNTIALLSVSRSPWGVHYLFPEKNLLLLGAVFALPTTAVFLATVAMLGPLVSTGPQCPLDTINSTGQSVISVSIEDSTNILEPSRCEGCSMMCGERCTSSPVLQQCTWVPKLYRILV